MPAYWVRRAQQIYTRQQTRYLESAQTSLQVQNINLCEWTAHNRYRYFSIQGPFLTKKKTTIRDLYVVNRDYFLSRFTTQKITNHDMISFRFSINKSKHGSRHFVVARYICLIKAQRDPCRTNGIRRPVRGHGRLCFVCRL